MQLPTSSPVAPTTSATQDAHAARNDTSMLEPGFQGTDQIGVIIHAKAASINKLYMSRELLNASYA